MFFLVGGVVRCLYRSGAGFATGFFLMVVPPLSVGEMMKS